MKAYAFVVLTIIISACFGQIRYYQEDPLLKQVFGACYMKHQISMEAMESILGHVDVPDDYEVKCWISCVMKTLGMMKEGKIDWVQCKVLFKKGLTGEENKTKVDKIAEICQAKVPLDEKDECQLAYSAAVCKIDKWKEFGLPKVNME